MAAPNMALQRTRALAFARVRSLPSVARRSPLNARPLGHTMIPWRLTALIAGLVFQVTACSTTTARPTVLAYQSADGVWHPGGHDIMPPVPEDLVPPEWPPAL